MDLNNPINLVAREETFPNMLNDLFFTTTAFFSRLRENVTTFNGGSFTKSVFRFAPMIGSSYAVGATFEIAKRQTVAGQVLNQRFYQVSIPEYLEELQVYAKGEAAVFSLLDEDLENGMSTIETMMAIDSYGDGVTDITKLNGIAEVMNDGTVYSWNGKKYPTYLEAPRTGAYGDVLNSTPYWCGNDDGSTGEINFIKFEEAYREACRGVEEPDLIVMNKAAFSYIKNKQEPQQRNMQERDPYWGGSGFRFNNALVLVDEYCPSLKYGKTDDENFGLGNFKTSTISNNLTGTPPGGFPNSTAAATLYVGEVALMFNTKWWYFRLTDDEMFGGGFSGFMGYPNSNKVVGRVNMACNIQCTGARFQKQLLGIGG